MLLWLKGRFQRRVYVKITYFRYMYARHPFDDANYFDIEADCLKTANQKAIAYYRTLFETGQTVLLQFHFAGSYEIRRLTSIR